MVFDQLKKINELRKLQGDMKKEKIVVEKRGVTVEMNGEFAVENIKLNPELGIEDQQDALKQCLNEAREGIQKRMAQVMMNSGISF